jgi:hypothetical protein
MLVPRSPTPVRALLLAFLLGACGAPAPEPSRAASAPTPRLLGGATTVAPSVPGHAEPAPSDEPVAPPSPVLWARALGDPVNAEAQSVAVDRAGNTWIAGYFHGDSSAATPTNPPLGELPSFAHHTSESAGVRPRGEWDADTGFGLFLAKLDPAGNPLFLRGYGPIFFGEAHVSIATGPDDGLHVAASALGIVDFGKGPSKSPRAPGVFLAKLDPEGRARWARSSHDGAHAQRVFALRVDTEGRSFLAGELNGTFDLGNKASRASSPRTAGYLAALDADGTPLFTKVLRGSGASTALALALALGKDDTLYVGGRFEGALPLSTNASSLARAQSRGFVAALRRDGKALWSRVLDERGQGTSVIALAADPRGGLVTSTSFHDRFELDGQSLDGGPSENVALTRFDAKGRVIWLRGLTEQRQIRGESLAIDEKGNLTLAGFCNGTPRFDERTLACASPLDLAAFFALRLDPEGALRDSFAFGDRNAQSARAVALDPKGAAVIAGGGFGSIELGATRFSPGNHQDAWVVKLAP